VKSKVVRIEEITDINYGGSAEEYYEITGVWEEGSVESIDYTVSGMDVISYDEKTGSGADSSLDDYTVSDEDIIDYYTDYYMETASNDSITGSHRSGTIGGNNECEKFVACEAEVREVHEMFAVCKAEASDVCARFAACEGEAREVREMFAVCKAEVSDVCARVAVCETEAREVYDMFAVCKAEGSDGCEIFAGREEEGSEVFETVEVCVMDVSDEGRSGTDLVRELIDCFLWMVEMGECDSAEGEWENWCRWMMWETVAGYR